MDWTMVDEENWTRSCWSLVPQLGIGMFSNRCINLLAIC